MRPPMDDAAAPESAHRRDHELAEPRQPEDVDLELAAGLVDGHVLECAVRPVTSVVDEHVQTPLLTDDAVNASAQGCVIRDIHRDHLASGCLELLHPVYPPRCAVNDPAARSERECRGVADP